MKKRLLGGGPVFQPALIVLAMMLALVAASAACHDSATGADAGADGNGDDAGVDAGGDGNVQAANLLCNPGFEEGESVPECWDPFPPPAPGVTYGWEEGPAQNGSRSVSVAIADQQFGMWQQLVPVAAGRVYLLAGHVGFEDIVPPGRCNLQIVFRDDQGQLVQMINYPHHDGKRTFELDFPTNLKVRAPQGAVQAEVNLFLQGPGQATFDDIFFGPAPLGTIAGTVTSGGSPLQDALVTIAGEHWNESYRALTDSAGRYEISDVPVAFPRYILVASKEGYKTRTQGRVEVLADGVTNVDFQLDPGTDPADDLQVKSGTLSLVRFTEPPLLPQQAVIPAEASDYPESVRVYLQPDETIESDHPDVVALAGQILSSVENKTSTHDVAWAVYEWVSRNIDHDGVYDIREQGGLDQPFKDETSGIWQTISGRGWCWGRNMLDWTYQPHELLRVKGGICVEHALLVSALLRALNIPARAFSGALEFYAQVPGQGGAWFHMSTTGGRTAYREHGELGPGFADGGPLRSFPVTAGPMMHEDWNAARPGLWHERHPWGAEYFATQEGLDQALADLENFAQTGQAAPGRQVPPGQDRYAINYRDITLRLFDIGEQRLLDVRFPIGNAADTVWQQHDAYWTNHPECVTRTWVEEKGNPPVDGTERWFHIEFDLTSLVE